MKSRDYFQSNNLTINIMNSVLYIIGAIVVIVVILKVLGLY